jgi:hypothetical protein
MYKYDTLILNCQTYTIQYKVEHRLPFLNLVLRPIDPQRKLKILPNVLYVCETLCLALREENRLEVFENRALRMCVPKIEEVT